MGHRVALVTSSYHPWFGGVEEHVRHVARELQARGHDVVVWSVDRGDGLDVANIDGIEVRYLPTPLPAQNAGALARFLRNLLPAWRAWDRARRDFRPDLLHVHCFGPNGVYALAMHRRYGVPLIVTSHGETFADDHGAFDESILIRTSLRGALARADQVTAVSSIVLDDLRNRFGARGGVVVPNGVDLRLDHLDMEEAQDTPSDSRLVVLGVGRLERNKGFDLLIDAFDDAGLADRARLVLVGDGAERESLTNRVFSRGLAESVELVGRLSPSDVARWMRQSAVVAVPSRVEAFGLVALEAWRAEAPLVMTNRGGARDFVTDDVNGLLVDPEHVEALGAALRRVLDDAPLAARLRSEGSKAVARFTWNAVAEQYEMIYTSARGGYRSHRETSAHRPMPQALGPRVVVLDHTGELGGAELALVRMLDSLGDRAEVSVVLFADGPLVEQLRSRGHSVQVLPLASSINSLPRHAVGVRSAARSAASLAVFLVRLVRLVKRLDVDVIQTTSLKADLVGLPVAVSVRRPLVWHLHDRISPDYLPSGVVSLIRAASRCVHAVVANSSATASTLPGTETVVAAPGLDPLQIRDQPRPRPSGAPVIGVVGRISPTKDQLTFVRAAALVHEAYPEASFVIVGSPAFGAEPYERAVREEIELLGLSAHVRLIGFSREPSEVFDQLAVGVHTAAVPEPFGQVVTEAMARGVPVVATSGGGIDEIFGGPAAGGPVGWLVPPSSPARLAAAIIEALSDPEEAERRGRAGWEHVKTTYPVASTAETILGVWQRAAALSRRSRR
jgi:glycosyltransferase involved in cell wall biosynthesis